MAAFGAVILLVVACLQLSESRYSMHLKDRLYLPFEYTPIPRLEYNRNAAEQVTFDRDEGHPFAYVIGENLIHVIDVEDDLHLNNLHHHHQEDFIFRDIAICGDYVIVAADNTVTRSNGQVFIFHKYTRISGTMPLINQIPVGHNPKSLAVSANCQSILVACEGKAYFVGPAFTNPEGEVFYIHFLNPDLGGEANTKSMDFTEFNPHTDDYVTRGVRFVYRNESDFSQDLEPESVTMNSAETHAYVSLQENNAIAVLDITDFSTAKVTEIYALGFKRWHDLLMDPSDLDQEVKLSAWKVFGMYQPDQIKYFEVDGTGYILCANEGSDKEYGLFYNEAKRGQTFIQENLVDSGVSQDLQDSLTTSSNLGRLEFSIETGKNQEGKFTDFYSFGARSFSIRRADDPSIIVYDSGDLSERHHQALTPITFNTDPHPETQTVLQTRDTRSDNKGPEPESVAVGVIDGETLFFIGNERTGSVEIYSTRHGVSAPLFHNISTLSPWANVGKNWKLLYDERNTGDLDPEGLEFIDARHSPTLKPLLLVSGAVSGTLSVYEISLQDEIEDDFLAAKIDSLFTKADNDSNERLSLDEHEWLLLRADVDSSHRVDLEEFTAVYTVDVGLLPDKAQFVFNEFDRDNDKFLTSFDASGLFYYSDRDATATVTRDQFGREWKRIFHENISLE